MIGLVMMAADGSRAEEEQRQLAGSSSEKCVADLARISDASELVFGTVAASVDRYS
jgi:hypothetical protein